MTYQSEFARNMRRTTWEQLFPHWWSPNDLIKVIGDEIERLKAEWLFKLLNSGIKPPVMLWKTDIDYKAFTREKHITQNSDVFELPAPIYKTHGILEITNQSSEHLSYIKIMLNDEDGILINQPIKINETLTIDTENEIVHIDDKRISPTKYGNGFEYFKTSQNNKKYDVNTPLHNEILRLKFSTNSKDIDFNAKVTLKNAVFITEQNIEVTSAEILALEKIELYVYYDFPFNQEQSGWRKAYIKEYDEGTNVLADMVTVDFFSQKYYVEVYFKGVQYPYKVGFPCSSEESDDSIYHVNKSLDNWGELLGLKRRFYKKNIPKEDYPFTFPIFYPYDIEQDFWYYSRLINEYCWGEGSINDIDLIDTKGSKVMRLHSIDPFVQDFVVHAKTIKPTQTKKETYEDYIPTTVTQNSSVAAKFKQSDFINIDNLLTDDENYAVINLYQQYGNYIDRESYKSKELDVMFDLSNLPEDINIKGLEIKIEGKSTDNSTEKYNDSRTRILLLNKGKEVYSKSINSTQTFGINKETIEYGGPNEKFGLENSYEIDNKKIDTRDLLAENGLHFILSFINDNDDMTTTIAIYNIYLFVYYEQKRKQISLNTEIKIDKNNSKSLGQLITTVKNIGEKPINTHIDIFNEDGIGVDINHIPISLNVGDKREDIINIYPTLSSVNKTYQLLTSCENVLKKNSIIYSKGGQIETGVYISPYFVTYGEDIDLKAKILTFNKLKVQEGVVRFYIEDYYIGESKIFNGEATLSINSKNINQTITTGLFNLEARYIGSTQYQPSRKYSSILISKKHSSIKITSDLNAVTEKEYICSAEVSINNETINEGKITFFIDDEEIGSSEVENNKVEFPYIIEQKAGNHILKAEFNGSVSYSHSIVEEPFIIIGGETISSVFDVEGSPGEKVRLIGKVTDINHQELKDGQIKFEIITDNDIIEELETVPIDKTGKAICLYEIDENILPKNSTEEIEYQIKTTYIPKNEIYKISSKNGILKIKRKEVSIRANTVIASRYEPIGFLFELTDSVTQEKITNGHIQLSRNGQIFAEGDVDEDGYCRVVYNPILFAQQALDKLSNFKFEIREENSNGKDVLSLVYIYQSDVEYDDNSMFFKDIGIDFFIENKNLIIETDESIGDPSDNIFIQDGILYATTSLTNAVEFFNTGTHLYNMTYTPDKIYRQIDDVEKRIVINDSNVNLDLLSYHLKYNTEPSIVCYITRYDFDEENPVIKNGELAFYIDNNFVDKVPFNIESDKIKLTNGIKTISNDDNYKISFIENQNEKENAIIVEFKIKDLDEYSANNHLLQAEYIYNTEENDPRYTNTITSSLFDISKLDTHIETKHENVFLGETSKLNIKIDSLSEKDIIIDGIVQLFLNNNLIDSYYLTKEDNGECFFYFDIPEDANTLINDEPKYYYTVKYLGNEFTNESEYKQKLESKKQEVTVSTRNFKTTQNTLCDVKVQITTDPFNIISDGIIVLKYQDIINNEEKEIGTIKVKENEAKLQILIDESYEIGRHQFSLEFKDSTNFIQDSNASMFYIDVIEALDVAYVDNKIGLDSNIGTEKNPFQSFNQALRCVKENGTIIIISSAQLDNEVNINKSVNIEGRNNSVLEIADSNIFYTEERAQKIKSLPFEQLNELEHNTNHDFLWRDFEGLEDILFSSNFYIQDNSLYYEDNTQNTPLFTMEDGSVYGYTDFDNSNKNVVFDIPKNTSVSFNNIEIVSKLNTTIKNYGTLNITHSIIPKEITIDNLERININRNLFYGNINNTNNSNLNHNWWGSNEERYPSENNITLHIEADDTPVVLGEDIQVTAYFKGKNNEVYDLPSPTVYFTADSGYFSNDVGRFVNNKLSTQYYDGIMEGEIRATVDNQTVSLDIYDYDRKTQIILEEIDIPSNYQIPLVAKVQSAATSFYKFDEDNNIINQDKKINSGRIIFFISQDDSEFREIGKADVIDGKAVLPVYFTSKVYPIDSEYKLKAKYQPTDYYFASENTSKISIIDSNDILYVDPNGSNLNSGSFNSPIQSIQEAVNRNPRIIYLKEGEYLDENIMIDNIVIKKYSGVVEFKNKDNPIFNIKESGKFYGIDFINNNDILFNNKGFLYIEKCIFENNNKKSIISCSNDSKTEIIYSAIVNSTIDEQKNDFSFEYNWWGTNDIQSYQDMHKFDNWIVMDINAGKSSILIDSVTKIYSGIYQYENKFGRHDLNTTLPLRIAKFFTNAGSLMPIKDYTYNNMTDSLFNGLDNNNTEQLVLIVDENINYFNQENFTLKCKISDVYDNPVPETIIKFEINHSDIKIRESAKTDRDGVATVSIPNSLYKTGEYPILCSTNDYGILYQNWGTLKIIKPKIILQNVQFTNIGLQDSILSFNAIDSSGELIDIENINITIKNKNDTEVVKNKYGNESFVINNNSFEEEIHYNLKKAGQYVVNIKNTNTEYYEELNENYYLIIKEIPTYINFNTTQIQLKSNFKALISVLDNKANSIKPIYENNSLLQHKLSVFKIEGNGEDYIEDENSLIIKNGICSFDFPIIAQPGTYAVIIQYPGLPGYYQSSVYYGTIDVGVNKVKIDSEELQNQLKIKMDDSIDLSFPIYDINDDFVESGRVEFYVNNLELGYNDNGEFKTISPKIKDGYINISCDDIKYGDFKSSGIYPFEIRYYDVEMDRNDGDSPKKLYADTIFKTNLIVEQYNTDLYIDPIFAKSKELVSVPFEIQSEKGNVNFGVLTAYCNDEAIGEVNLKQRSDYINLRIPFLQAENEYIITFKYYDESNQLKSFEKDVFLFIEKRTPQIKVLNEKTHYYPLVNIPLKLEINDEENDPINNGTISLYQDNILKETVDVKYGQALFNLYFADTKQYKLDFVYNDELYYNNVNYHLNIETLNLPINDIYIKELYDKDGNVIENILRGSSGSVIDGKLEIESDYEIYDGTITLFINNIQVGQYNIESKNKYISFEIPTLDEGEYILDISYTNSDLFEDRINDNSFKIPIYVTKRNIEIEISCPNEIKSQNTLTINGRINNAISEVKGVIKFYIADNNQNSLAYQYIGMQEIENDNTFIYSYPLPSNTPSDLSIKGVFSGNTQYEPAEAECYCTIIKNNSSMEINDYEAQYGDTIDISVYSDSLKGEIISLYLDEKPIGNNIVNDDGYCIFRYNIVDLPNNYNLIAKFNGSANLNKSESVSTLTVEKADVYLKEDEIEAYICKDINLPKHFVDRNQNSVPAGSVIYNYNNELIPSENFYFDSIESINIDVQYIPFNKDSDKYNPANLTLKINPVKNKTNIEIDNINKDGYVRGVKTNDIYVNITSLCECPIESDLKISYNDFDIEYEKTDDYHISFIMPNQKYKNEYDIKFYIEESDKFLYSEKIISFRIINKDVVYVDINGDNNNSGDIDSPVKTIEKAIDILNPNGIIYINEGSFSNEEFVIDKNIKVIGDNTTIEKSKITNNFVAEIFNINFDNSQIINNDEISLIDSDLINNSNLTTNNNLIVDNCKFINNSNTPIIVTNRNINTIIENSLFKNNGATATNYGGCIFSNNGNDIEISNNLFIDNRCPLGGNSIAIIGNGDIYQNTFINEGIESEIKILSGVVEIENNLFNTTNKCLEILTADVSAELNFWGVNQNIYEKIDSPISSGLNIDSWLVASYRTTLDENENMKIYPLINQYDSKEEVYTHETDINQDYFNAYFTVKDAKLSKEEVLINKEFTTVYDINDNPEIYMKIGQEEIKIPIKLYNKIDLSLKTILEVNNEN